MALDNKNIGALFLNNKNGDPSRPDLRGSIRINGITFNLSGWEATAKKSGKKYIRLEADPAPQASENASNEI
jgi:hypothetical protein